jgi:hypothetical protein
LLSAEPSNFQSEYISRKKRGRDDNKEKGNKGVRKLGILSSQYFTINKTKLEKYRYLYL